MTAFGDHLRDLMTERGVSLRKLAAAVHFDVGYLSRAARGLQPPSAELVAALDAELGAGGTLIEAAAPPLDGDDQADADDEAGVLLDFMRRAEASDLGPGTLDVTHATIDQLCREYPTMPGPKLRKRGNAVMNRVLGMLDMRTTLAEHRELLVAAGWLAALLGCVHYDVGDRIAAETARRVAFQLGEQAGHGEIIAWSFEMAAWFALTEGRYPDVVAAAQAGQEHAGVTSAGVQLALQEAKAWARMGDSRAEDAMKAGNKVLAQLPRPTHPEHHFVFDPSKAEFYAATIYALLGWNDVAEEHAREVIDQCQQPTGTRWPMRLADARVNLGLVAGRRGDLDEAVHHGRGAFEFKRRSGALFSRAGDLLAELNQRYPGEPLVGEYRDFLATAKASA
ncbi:helix-turn-helix domain-containing protein [Allonocardiopsis opalescens]|uniref:Helix-turn-helix protein n=1 Tax=Allonocardiopsis opalescens TaxID=1144618 RepID=A0A2T0QA17_9ACTN|nr:helix-turn-helix transcriptional regulator [Allonocardiopsis opalescens]PRY00693.1 helix-turn-helix protein [Allonocardiopsis opalescens]